MIIKKNLFIQFTIMKWNWLVYCFISSPYFLVLLIIVFRVLREEWEKREELERLQEEHILLLEQEREKRKEFEIKQREKENQLLGKTHIIIH